MYVATYKAGQDRQEANILKIAQAQVEATQANATAHDAQEQATRAIEEANAKRQGRCRCERTDRI